VCVCKPVNPPVALYGCLSTTHGQLLLHEGTCSGRWGEQEHRALGESPCVITNGPLACTQRKSQPAKLGAGLALPLASDAGEALGSNVICVHYCQTCLPCECDSPMFRWLTKPAYLQSGATPHPHVSVRSGGPGPQRVTGRARGEVWQELACNANMPYFLATNN